jgi:hypothetical protein
MAYTTLCAVALSVLAGLNNHGLILTIARFFRFTNKTSSVDVWQDV